MGHLLCSICMCPSALDRKPTVGHLCFVLSVCALGTRPQAHCGSLALFYLSVPSALDCKPTVGHSCSVLCSICLCRPSAPDCKPTVGHLLCYICLCVLGTRLHARCGSLALFYLPVCALGTRLQAHCGSLALFYLSVPSALDRKPTVGHLLCSICLCPRH
jgi:hypothetical protein